MLDPHFDEQLSAYFDNEAGDEERASLERTLEQSPDLRRKLDDFRQLSELLHELPQQGLPPEFAAEVLQVAERRMLLESQPQPARDPAHSLLLSPVRRFPFYKAGSVLAAGVVLFVGIQVYNQQRAPRPVPDELPVVDVVELEPVAGNRVAGNRVAGKGSDAGAGQDGALVPAAGEGALLRAESANAPTMAATADRDGEQEAPVSADRAGGHASQAKDRAKLAASPAKPQLASGNAEAQRGLQRDKQPAAAPLIAEAKAAQMEKAVPAGKGLPAEPTAEPTAEQGTAKRKSLAEPTPSVADSKPAPAPAVTKLREAPRGGEQAEADGWQVGQVIESIESVGTTPGKVAVVQIYVIDRRKGMEEVQLVLKTNSIEPPATGKPGEVAKSEAAAKPVDVDGREALEVELHAVYVTATSEQLAEALRTLKSHESIVDLAIEPPVEIARLDPPTQSFFHQPQRTGPLQFSVNGQAVGAAPGGMQLKIGVAPAKRSGMPLPAASTGPASAGSAGAASGSAKIGIQMQGQVRGNLNGGVAGGSLVTPSRQMAARAPRRELPQQADEKQADADAVSKPAAGKGEAKQDGLSPKTDAPQETAASSKPQGAANRTEENQKAKKAVAQFGAARSAAQLPPGAQLPAGAQSSSEAKSPQDKSQNQGAADAAGPAPLQVIFVLNERAPNQAPVLPVEP